MAYWDFTKKDKIFKERKKDLSKLINEMKCDKHVIIEIGIYKGSSARAFSILFDKVYSIDIVPKAIDHLKEFNLKNVYPILRDEKTIEKFNNGSIDVVYIDGDHTYEGVMKDIEEYYPKIKSGGYLAGHDYGPGHNDVKKAILKFFGREPDLLMKGTNFYYKK